jgi:hypothetical protein
VLLASGSLLHHPLQHERHLLYAAKAFGLENAPDGVPKQLGHLRGIRKSGEEIIRGEHAFEEGELWRWGKRQARVRHVAGCLMTASLG